MRFLKFIIPLVIIAAGLAWKLYHDNVIAHELDYQLRHFLKDQAITPLSAEGSASLDPAKVELGQLLYFDKLLSGNKDISCATCHHPDFNSGDALPVSIGTGGHGLGTERILGSERDFIPRNAPDIYNRGLYDWQTMFWDSRVALNDDGTFRSPAKQLLPPGLDNVLAVQAMFPVTSRDEMRGQPGDLDTLGQPNELALLEDDDLTQMWALYTQRLLTVADYAERFAQVYPDVPADQIGFELAANAIAAFETQAFTFINSPWNRYVVGDSNAISEPAKRGAILFFGPAGCSHCHAGPLLSDQQHYNLAVPQIGPGKGTDAPADLGFGRTLEQTEANFTFRTPSLHQVSLTGPYMHNGAYSTLEATVKHHLDPLKALHSYNPAEHLPPALQDTFQNDPAFLAELEATLATQVRPETPLTEPELADLLAFLDTLTDPAAAQLQYLIPESVPSGLPVSD